MGKCYLSFHRFSS